jgi:hypothetical protein
MERIPFPVICGDFITIYRPDADIYRGADTLYFKENTYYENWTVNDFSIINDNGHWHILGITHPTPPGFTDEYKPVLQIHDAEHMLFHAQATGKTMAEVMSDGKFTDCPKILYPKERPDEIPECHAPHILSDGAGGFNIFYGPQYMRLAFTRDFCTFERRTLFADDVSARDPFVFEENGLYYIIYAVQNRVDYRTTRNFTDFSEPVTLQVNPFRSENGTAACSESPIVFKRKGFYYLMWSIWDERAGVYDHRAFLFGARSFEGLADTAPLTMLPAHAGEIYSDESGDYLLSVFYPENGINVARIAWENDTE